ncbi:NLR family CARD domain-containing protein 4-like [Branchiostoma floridae]|uniref:NLR family CARD domain-containing protein 4-like n=1 Tax=Branchiostoma floridae TaxID=7739 RepID=A0A9J7LZG7_BRAFL|nr:NLR family CARD domain-containing protein 4-like [Branchiostoma floridae]
MDKEDRMSWTDRFNNPEYKNWLRVGLALLAIRHGLSYVTLQAAKDLHAELLKAELGNSIGKCTCNHKSNPKREECEHCAWRQELKKHYTGDADRIGWTNCTPSKWSKEPWEVAKVFMLKMPKSQAAENTGPEMSDPSALLNFLVHCTFCHKYVNVKSAQRVIEIRNQAMHSLDLTFDRDTFNNHMEKLRSLMCDPKLASDPAAQKAAKEITKLKKEEFHLGANKACMDAEVRVFKHVMSEHKKQLQLYREELEDHGARLDTLEHTALPKKEMLKTVEVLLGIVNNNTGLHRALKDQALELSTTVQQIQDRLGKAEGDITDVRGAVGQLEEVVAKHDKQIEEVKTDNKRLDEEISDVKNQSKKIKLSVDEVKQKLEAPSGSTPSLAVFQTSVKKYFELKLGYLKPLIWNDNFTLNLSDIFTQLELIQTMAGKQRKELKSLDDLFNPDVTGLSTAPRCILIEGEAGGGKTTFLSKEALDAVSQKTELGRQYDIVLLIRLREVREGETIEEMVWDQCVPETTEGIDVQSTRTILQMNKSRVLFLLDGYDELQPEARAAGQAIPKLLSGKLYPNSTIVITSRPSAGMQQYTRPDCHVHIRGFSPEYMVKYVKKYFIRNADMAEDFIRQYFTVIRNHRPLAIDVKVLFKNQDLLDISNLFQTPIFLMLVCVLWEEDQEMVSTGTMTGLYNNLLTCLVRKHCKREGVDMPTKGLPTDLVAKPLLQFGKLALEALLRNEILLDITEVQRENVNWELLLKLGVVSLEVSSSKLHPRKQLNFSHKTMQEFLAGRYVAHALLNQDIVELLQLTSISKVFELSNLLQFTCGCDSRAAQAVMEELSILSSREFAYVQPEHFEDTQKSCKAYEEFANLCLNILCERQEPEVLQGISQALPIVILKSSINSREATALKYYIQNLHSANLPDRLIVDIQGVSDSRDTVQYLQQCFATSLPELRLDLNLISGQVDSPSGQYDSPDVTARLVSVLKNVPGLRVLKLIHTDLTPSSLLPLVQGFSHMSLLEMLDLSLNPNLSDAGMEVLQAGLSCVPHLAILRLMNLNMTDVGISYLSPIMRHLVGLRYLNIHGNFISDRGLQCLAANLHHLTAMKVLVLNRTGISDTGISSLIKALPHLVQLQVLDVWYNNIGDSGIVSLVQTLCQPSSLDMEQNPPGDKSLATAPHYNTTLQKLDIGFNSGVTAAGLGRVTQLISALPALTRLDMSGCRYTPAHLSDTAAMALAEVLPKLPALEWLDLEYISMEPAGFQAVVQAAEEHPTLENLGYTEELFPEGADTTASCLNFMKIQKQMMMIYF